MPALSTVYEDAHVVVANKPSGLLVHNSAFAGPRERTLLDLARDDEKGPLFAVHRLDRGTSGLVVLARSSDDARAWQAALAVGEKSYVALVRGRVDAALHVDNPVKDEEGARKDARSDVAPLATVQDPRCSLVEVRLHTGRRHQARQHLKHVSHPVLGDASYGKGALNRDYAARFGLARLALHARRLSLVHPATGAAWTVEAALPDDLRGPLLRIFGAEVLQRLGL